MRNIIILMAAIFLANTTLEAIQEYAIDEKRAHSILLSNHSHNRIAVSQGGVEKIFGDPAYFNITIDQITGQAFINIVRTLPDRGTTLTLITRSGYTQDLNITAGDVPSEHVILKEPGETPEDIATNFQTFAIDTLNAIFSGETPIGYGQRVLTQDDNLELPSPLAAQPIKAFNGIFETLVIYRITNAGKENITIKANALKRERDSWAFINANHLKPKEQAVCVIASHRKMLP